MKIAIIGNCGSGKSQLALQLHKILKIPLYHLDQYYWKPGWQRPDTMDFVYAHRELCGQPAWIIEGIATRIFEYRIAHADMVIFLDIPTYICLYRVLKRASTHFGKVYFSSAPGCQERGPRWEFLKFIWRFNKDKRPRIRELMEHYKNGRQVFIVKNNKELEALLKKFESYSINQSTYQ